MRWEGQDRRSEAAFSEMRTRGVNGLEGRLVTDELAGLIEA